MIFIVGRHLVYETMTMNNNKTIRKKAKYGNPTDDFGQPAIGGLINIDQRQLNRVYCESVRQRVAQDELIQTIRHTIQENLGLTIGEFGPILTLEFGPILRHRDWSRKTSCYCMLYSEGITFMAKRTDKANQTCCRGTVTNFRGEFTDILHLI